MLSKRLEHGRRHYGQKDEARTNGYAEILSMSAVRTKEINVECLWLFVLTNLHRIINTLYIYCDSPQVTYVSVYNKFSSWKSVKHLNYTSVRVQTSVHATSHSKTSNRPVLVVGGEGGRQSTSRLPFSRGLESRHTIIIALPTERVRRKRNFFIQFFSLYTTPTTNHIYRVILLSFFSEEYYVLLKYLYFKNYLFTANSTKLLCFHGFVIIAAKRSSYSHYSFDLSK